MNHSEHVAELVIPAALAGTRLRYRQGAGVHDFDLERDGQVCGAVEVTSITDPHVRATKAAIRKHLKGGCFVEANRCTKRWYVLATPTANINRIRERLDESLAEIEKHGVEGFSTQEHGDWCAYEDNTVHGPWCASIRRIYEDLSIKAGTVVGWLEAAHIVLGLAGECGWVAPSQIIPAIEKVAYEADNRKKLGASMAGEKHLFVYVDPDEFLLYARLLDQPPPPNVPSLPLEIDTVWVATEANWQPRQYVVWRADRGQPFINLGLIPQ